MTFVNNETNQMGLNKWIDDFLNANAPLESSQRAYTRVYVPSAIIYA